MDRERFSIFAGVYIADGIIVVAGVVVTKDTELYSIVGGVLAKLIRYRFEEDDIEYLLNLHWWNKGEDWIRKNAELFSDVKYLRKVLGEQYEICTDNHSDIESI